MNLIRAPLETPDASLAEVALRVDRVSLSKRLWRGTADDGAEFGFELEAPLRHGQTIAQTANGRYVIRQNPEPVLEIPLAVAAEAAAVIGWAVGNLHFAIEAQPNRILAPDDSGLRQTLDRLGIQYHSVVEVFQPHRLSAVLAGHGLFTAKPPTIVRI
jgi:urease accessory protein